MTSYRLLDHPGSERLRLMATGDGWSLVGRDGAVVYSALGTGGRRQCLAFACAGVVAALAV
jgi:hypothetical protein